MSAQSDPGARCPLPDPLPVAVLPEDLRDGVRGLCSRCPTASAVDRAVAAALPDRWVSVHVFRDVLVDIPGGGRWVAAFPAEPDVLAWIAAFDAGRPVEPVAFALTDWRPEEEDDDGDD